MKYLKIIGVTFVIATAVVFGGTFVYLVFQIAQ